MHAAGPTASGSASEEDQSEDGRDAAENLKPNLVVLSFFLQRMTSA